MRSLGELEIDMGKREPEDIELKENELREEDVTCGYRDEAASSEVLGMCAGCSSCGAQYNES